MMKAQTWRYEWRDGTEQRGLVTRSRVAYLLHGARSRGERIVRTEAGYQIGTLTLANTAKGSTPGAVAGRYRTRAPIRRARSRTAA